MLFLHKHRYVSSQHIPILCMFVKVRPPLEKLIAPHATYIAAITISGGLPGRFLQSFNIPAIQYFLCVVLYVQVPTVGYFNTFVHIYCPSMEVP